MTMSDAVLLLQRARSRPLTGMVRAVVHEHRVYLIIVAAYLAAGIVADCTGLVPGLLARMNYTLAYVLIPVFALLAMPGLLAVEFGQVLQREQTAGRRTGWSDWPRLAGEAIRSAFPPDRLVRAALVVGTVPALLVEFSAWKASLTTINPFSWDARLAALDRWMHLGRHPWEWLQPLLGRPPVTGALDVLYSSWLYLVPCVVVAQAWRRDLVTRQRFFITFALAWILLGTAAAIGLSSAGPAFYAQVTGGASPYAGLLHYLQDVNARDPVFALWLQDWLWQAYVADGALPFARISAMPSMHVAMVVLYFLSARNSGLTLSLAFAGYAVLILLGSVHLGWHYGVDGYVSAGATVSLWAGSAYLARHAVARPRQDRVGRNPPYRTRIDGGNEEVMS